MLVAPPSSAPLPVTKQPSTKTGSLRVEAEGSEEEIEEEEEEEGLGVDRIRAEQ